MPLSSTEAAAVARNHGLTLGDAAALQRLADTTDEADELAAQFAGRPVKDPEKAATRQLARNLFAAAKKDS